MQSLKSLQRGRPPLHHKHCALRSRGVVARLAHARCRVTSPTIHFHMVRTAAVAPVQRHSTAKICTIPSQRPSVAGPQSNPMPFDSRARAPARCGINITEPSAGDLSIAAGVNPSLTLMITPTATSRHRCQVRLAHILGLLASQRAGFGARIPQRDVRALRGRVAPLWIRVERDLDLVLSLRLLAALAGWRAPSLMRVRRRAGRLRRCRRLRRRRRRLRRLR